MKLGFDLDGVLANYDSGFREVLEQVVRKPLSPKPPEVWEWPAALGVTEEQEQEALERVHRSPTFWADLERTPGFDDMALKRLQRIAETDDLYFITDRPMRGAKRQSEEWLKKFGLPPSVLITPHKGLAAKVLNLDAYIDDRPDKCVDVTWESKTTAVYLQRRLWNRHYQPAANIYAVDSVMQMLDREGCL